MEILSRLNAPADSRGQLDDVARSGSAVRPWVKVRALPRSLRFAVLGAQIIATTPPRKSEKARVTGPATKRAQSEKNEQPIPDAPHGGPHVFAPALRTYKSQKQPPSDLRQTNA